MLRPTKLAALALVAGLVASLALPVLADDKADLKKARADLKKNEKLLQQADAVEGENADALSKATEAATRIRQAENEEAVLFLLAYAAENDGKDKRPLAHKQVFEKIRDELASFANDDSMKAFATVLASKPSDKKISWRQRALAAEASAKIANPKITDAIMAALASDEANVLNPAIVAAGKREEKRVLGALVELLKRFEKAGGWEYHHIRQSLVELTGQDFFTYDTWKKWWDSNKDTFEFGKKGDAKEAKTQERIGANEKKPTFFNTEVMSNRFCFVINVSGSMKMTDLGDNPDDPVAVQKAQDKDPTDEFLKTNARIERAKTELRNAISKLDPSQKFNILSFSDQFKTFQDQIVPANDGTKKAALAWVDGLQAGGGTFTDDALMRTFEMADIDTVYFLSDGAPEKQNFGNDIAKAEAHQRDLMKKCYELVEKERRFRKITIHTFGLCGLGIWYKKWGTRPPSLSLDPKSVEPLRDFMKQLAEMTGGQVKYL